MDFMMIKLILSPYAYDDDDEILTEKDLPITLMDRFRTFLNYLYQKLDFLNNRLLNLTDSRRDEF